jgi:hypothetical protein
LHTLNQVSNSALQKASHGFGHLLQRDYWAVIRECKQRPSELLDFVAARFPEFAPENLCLFSSSDADHPGLRCGDTLNIKIRMAPHCQVTVLHRSATSLTLGTLLGHPEAGKITFGAYRNAHGDVIFHIRSRARSSSGPIYLGFFAIGEAMQTNTWTDFVNRVALTLGEGPLGRIHTETIALSEEEASKVQEEPDESPTFIANGD